MTEWQPIETAPKDGTVILVWAEWRGHNSGDHPWDYFFAWWPQTEHEKNEGTCRFDPKYQWRISDGFAPWCDPTHWMPLPEPPATPYLRSNMTPSTFGS